MIDETLKCGSGNILVVSMKCESNKHIKNYSKKDLNTQANNTKTKNTTFVDVHQDALDEHTDGRTGTQNNRKRCKFFIFLFFALTIINIHSQ